MLLLLLVAVAVSGCGGQEIARRGDTSSTLYIGEVGAAFPTSFMPWLSRDGVAPTISSMVYSTLLDYDEATDTFRPKLAASFAYLDRDLQPIVTPDGQVDYDRLEEVYGGSDTSFIPVRFQLNPDAAWSDGVKVTAEDVYFTFDLAACQKRSNHAGALVWVNDLMHKYDNSTGKLRRQGIFTYDHMPAKKNYPIDESERDTVFYLEISKVLGALTPLVSTVLILPEHIYADIISFDCPINNTSPTPALMAAYQHPVGCGPYTLDTAETNSQEIVLRRREDYFLRAEDGGALYRADTLKFILYQDINVAIYALKKGHIDVLDSSVSTNYAPLFEGQKDIVLLRAPGVFSQCLVLNLNAPPDHMTRARQRLTDPALRRAIALAMDQDALIENVLGGAGKQMPLGLLARDSELYNPEADLLRAPYEERLREANALLDALYPQLDPEGYRLDQGERLSFQVLGSPGEQEAISFLQVLMQKIGVELKFAPKGSSPENTYLYAGNFDMTLQGVSFTLSNIDIMYNSHFSNLVRSSNYGRLADPEINQQIGLMRSTLNRNTKFDLIRGLEGLIARQYYKLPLYCQDVLSVARTDHFTGWTAENGATAFNLESLQRLEQVSSQTRGKEEKP